MLVRCYCRANRKQIDVSLSHHELVSLYRRSIHAVQLTTQSVAKLSTCCFIQARLDPVGERLLGFLRSENILTDAPSSKMGEIMCEREQRGLAIAALSRIVQKGAVWIVPSQTGKGKYTVSPDEQTPYCSCQDHETTGAPCGNVAIGLSVGFARILHHNEPANFTT